MRQNVELELQYKSCYARILDSKRRFLEAATRYYELSQVGGRGSDGAQVRSRWTGSDIASCFCQSIVMRYEVCHRLYACTW